MLRRFKKTNLLICPNGHILGEVVTNGEVIIERYHQGMTRITGASFSVGCQQCNTMVFCRKGTINYMGTAL